jgi:sorbose reductase
VQKLLKEIYQDVGPVGGVVCNAGGSLSIYEVGRMAENSVGVAVSKPALEMTKEDYDQQMDVNVWGVFCVAQAAALYVSCTPPR